MTHKRPRPKPAKRVTLAAIVREFKRALRKATVAVKRERTA